MPRHLLLKTSVLPGASTLANAACSNLSVRELECLYLLATGHNNSGIASELGISLPTVALHLSNARRKLGAVTREHAIAIGVSKGIIAIG